jgi:preprotein translocase subunit SecA
VSQRRDEILLDGRLLERVYATAQEIVDEAIGSGAGREAGGEAATRILATLRADFIYTPGFAVEPGMKIEDLRERILEELRRDLERKEEDLGRDSFNMFVRYEYLRDIDSRWQDHLENLEALREAVYLRTYAQKNPLLEYKLEGFQIFDQMLEDIRRAIARKVLKVRIQAFEGRTVLTERRLVGDARHSVLGQFSAGGGAPAAVAAPGAASRATARISRDELAEASPQAVQVKRSQPKVGRNDPCPCGSGKKYKYCHGR